MDQARIYLEQILKHCRCTHLDMGGKHKYHLHMKAFPIIAEAKAWLASITPVQGDAECRCDSTDRVINEYWGKCGKVFIGNRTP